MVDVIDKFMCEQYVDLPELCDDVLISVYAKSKSVKSKVERLKTILVKSGLSHLKSTQVCKEILLDFLVPAGTKSKVRGDKFNNIVASKISCHIKNLKLKRCVFERESAHGMFHEIPDWILKRGSRILVGFNQISLYGGGHQLNRASKYILDDVMHQKLARQGIKMVCIVKDVPVTAKGKSHSILIKGIKAKRIYCVGGLKKLIKEYFVEKI